MPSEVMLALAVYVRCPEPRSRASLESSLARTEAHAANADLSDDPKESRA